MVDWWGFSDESYIRLVQENGKSWVRMGKVLKSEQPLSHKAGLMIWGSISKKLGKSRLIIYPSGKMIKAEVYLE